MLQSLAERVLAAAVGTGLEAVFRTFAPAGEIVFAPQAFGGQRIALGKAEIHPFARTVDLRQRRFADVAQLVFGIDEVVARIDVAVVLDDQRVAARLAHRADARGHAAPLGQRRVEHLHERTSHVAHHPHVEHVAQEPPVTLGRHRPFGQPRPLAVGRDDQRAVKPGLVDDMLHGRQELHVPAVHRVAEEAVDLPATPLAQTVHHAQRIVLHAAALEHFDRPHHPLESGPAALRQAERVVNVLRPVERNPHQKIVPGKEVAPRLVDQRAVGLEDVLDLLAIGVFLLEVHRLPVEIHPQQQRLAAVPAELHRRNLVGLDILFHVKFQQLVAHHGLPAAVLHGLVEVVAIVAVEVARRTGRLEHRRKGDRTRLFLRVAEGENILVLHVKVPRFTSETDRVPQLF